MTTDHKVLADQHADISFDRNGRKSWEFDDHGLEAFAAALTASPQVDEGRGEVEVTLSDVKLPPLIGTLADLKDYVKPVVEAYGRACARAALDACKDTTPQPQGDASGQVSGGVPTAEVARLVEAAKFLLDEDDLPVIAGLASLREALRPFTAAQKDQPHDD